MSNQEILMYLLKNTEGVSYGDDTTFKASELRETADKLFNDIQYKNEDINCELCDNVLFKYNEGKSKYSYNEDHAGHGGAGVVVIYNYLEDYTYQDNIFSIIVKKVFTDEEFGFSAGYASYADLYKKELIKYNDKCLEEEDGLTIYTDKCYTKYQDKLNKYEYRFQKIDERYQLVSY